MLKAKLVIFYTCESVKSGMYVCTLTSKWNISRNEVCYISETCEQHGNELKFVKLTFNFLRVLSE